MEQGWDKVIKGGEVNRRWRFKSNEQESSRLVRRPRFLSIPVSCLSSRAYLSNVVCCTPFSGINIGELTRNDDLRESLTRTVGR